MTQARKCGRVACATIFSPRRDDGVYCSRACANDDTKERRRNRSYAPQTQERIPARFGKPIIPPLAPPLCHGQALSFGSDPHTGVSTQYCRVCGECPVQRWGVATYPQRADFEAELQERYESVQRAPQQVGGRASGSSWGITVIGSALKRKIDAA